MHLQIGNYSYIFNGKYSTQVFSSREVRVKEEAREVCHDFFGKTDLAL